MTSGESSRFKLMLVFVTSRYGQPAQSVPWETLLIINSSTNSSCVDGRSLLVTQNDINFSLTNRLCVDYSAVTSDMLKIK